MAEHVYHKTCVRCGKTKPDDSFSRKNRYKTSKTQRVSNVCRLCAAEDDKQDLAERIRRRKEMKDVKKRVKKRILNEGYELAKDRLTTTLINNAIKDNRVLMTRSSIRKMKKEAVEEVDKRRVEKVFKKLQELNRELREKNEFIPPQLNLSDEELAYEDTSKLPEDLPDELHNEHNDLLKDEPTDAELTELVSELVKKGISTANAAEIVLKPRKNASKTPRTIPKPPRTPPETPGNPPETQLADPLDDPTLLDPKFTAKQERVVLYEAKKTGARSNTPNAAWKAACNAVNRGEAEHPRELTPKQKREAAKKELAQRELARRKLVHFVKRFKPNYEAGWVHHDICRRLERFMEQVAEGESPRLMLFLPPRHGKSLLASDMFPSWALGHHPEFEIIAASYAVSLPIEFSRNIRNRLEDPSYAAVFPFGARLRPDSKSAEAWRTKQGGGLVAAGVGGGITGKGAHIFVLDDPIKDAQEADSETVRDAVWNWWGSTAYTRLAPGGGVLVIQTRWHDADPSGRMIEQMKAAIKEGAPEDEIDNWEVIEYSAIAEDGDEWLMPDGSIFKGDLEINQVAHLLRREGEALHPERFDKTRLLRIKRTLQPRHWSALYQQKPMPDEGEYFTKSMFRYTSAVPPLKYLKLFIAGDLAIGENQQNDYTVLSVGGLDYEDQIYVFDLLRFKGDTYKIASAVMSLAKKYSPEQVGLEKGQLELAIKPILAKMMRKERFFIPLAEGKDALVPVTDKLKRARPLQGRMQQGMVYFLDTQPWLEAVQYELLRFPGGVHDDIVDSLAWLVRMIMNHEPPAKPGAKSKHKSWRDNLNAQLRGSARNPMLA